MSVQTRLPAGGPNRRARRSSAARRSARSS